MPRGSNSEVEVSRVKRDENSDYKEGRKGQGARHEEIDGYHGRVTNSKNPPAPSRS